MKIESIQVGDRVGYYRNHRGTFMEKGFGHVTKINGYGHIIVQPEGKDEEVKVFDKHHYERGKSQYNRLHLIAAKLLEEQLAVYDAHHAKQRAVRDLVKYIEGRRGYSGGYNIADEHKDEIKRLVDLI